MSADAGFKSQRRDGQPFTICNPRIMWKSQKKFSLWDDCMSFPGKEHGASVTLPVSPIPRNPVSIMNMSTDCREPASSAYEKRVKCTC